MEVEHNVEHNPEIFYQECHDVFGKKHLQKGMELKGGNKLVVVYLWKGSFSLSGWYSDKQVWS